MYVCENLSVKKLKRVHCGNSLTIFFYLFESIHIFYYTGNNVKRTFTKYRDKFLKDEKPKVLGNPACKFPDKNGGP